MKKILGNTLGYWLVVLKRALHIVWIETEMKGIVIATFLVFIVALSAYLAYSRGMIPVETVKEAWQQAIFQGVSIVVAGGLFIFVLLFVFAYLPAKMHDEHKVEIERLRKQIWPDIKLTLFPYVPNPNSEGDRWVGVKIINNSGAQAIERCKAKLYAVSNSPGTPLFFGGEELPADLQWSENNPPDINGFLTIPREGEVSLDIARSRNHYEEGSFTLARGDGFLKFPPGNYQVIFRIDGAVRIIDGGVERLIHIPPQQYSTEIILHKGFNLRIQNMNKS